MTNCIRVKQGRQTDIERRYQNGIKIEKKYEDKKARKIHRENELGLLF